jgi:hypothetical protein
MAGVYVGALHPPESHQLRESEASHRLIHRPLAKDQHSPSQSLPASMHARSTPASRPRWRSIQKPRWTD